MRKPILWILGIALGLSIVGGWLWRLAPPAQTQHQLTVTELPWLIHIDAKGNPQVFGVTVGVSTLQEAMHHWRDIPSVAYFAGGQDPGSLEAYFAKVKTGPLEARVILRLFADPAQLESFAAHAIDPKPMPSGSYKYSLPDTQYAQAHQLTIKELDYIPRAALDEQIIKQRFGEPAEFATLSDERTLWIYPAKRLAIVLDPHGKDVLQYAAGSHFESMRQQLLKAE